jgi:hypothetical protein
VPAQAKWAPLDKAGPRVRGRFSSEITWYSPNRLSRVVASGI